MRTPERARTPPTTERRVGGVLTEPDPGDQVRQSWDELEEAHRHPDPATDERRLPKYSRYRESRRHPRIEPRILDPAILNESLPHPAGATTRRSLYSGCLNNTKNGDHHANRHPAQEPNDPRGTRQGWRQGDAPGHRLRRRGLQQADSRRRPHLDRDDAVQLQPATSGRTGQGGRPGGRRHPDGTQHHRHLRWRDDGYRGDEGLAREPRGYS